MSNNFDGFISECTAGNQQNINVLISRNPNIVFDKDWHDWTCLHHVVVDGKNKIDVLTTLITHEANVNAATKEGETPLHLAVIQGDYDVVKLLLENKADVNATKKDGETPLHIAETNSHNNNSTILHIAELLLSKGAAVNAKDNKQETPLCRAIHHQRTGMIDLLRKNGGLMD